MRITHLRFANLNALAGEWSIDFEHPAFVDDGIFAITGPTGAGKTTILDAICLALYGSTPRLGRITTSNNEIMSRRQKDCFAEVSFETAKGRYCCYWGQRKSGKQDNLQPAKHELSDLSTGKVLTTKLTEVKSQIETLTGMDFEQFTRAMLLAQGSFAAFLQASPSERSPILEKITGTGIYTEISKAVYAKHKALKDELKDLQKTLDYTPLLTPEDVQLLQTQYDQACLQSKTLESQQKAQNEALQVHQEREQVLKRQQELQDLMAQLQQDEQDFAPRAEQLAADQRTEPLRDDFYALNTLREQLKKEQQEGELLQAKRLPAQRQAQEAEARFLALEQQYQQQQENGEASAQEWDAMRRMDEDLHQARQRLRIYTQQRSDKTNAQALLLQKQSDSQTNLELLNAALEKLTAQATATQRHGELVDTFSGLQEHHDSLMALQQEHATAHHELQRLQNQQTEADTQRQQAQHERLEAQHALNALKATLQTQAEALEEFPSTNQLQTEREALNTEIAQTQQAQQHVEQGQGLRQQLREQQREQEQIDAQMLQDAEKRAQKEAEHTELKDQEARLAYQQRLEARVINLEAYRQELSEGEPCPLCGATVHPFTSDGLDDLQPESTQKALTALSEKTAHLQAELQALQTAQHLAAQQREQIYKAQQNTLAQLTGLAEGLPGYTWQEDPDFTAYGAQLTARLTALQDSLEDLKKSQSAREQLEAQYNEGVRKQQVLSARLEAAHDQERHVQQATEAQAREQQHYTIQISTLEKQITVHLKPLALAWERYGDNHTAEVFPDTFNPQAQQTLTAFISTLQGYKNGWQTLQQQLQKHRGERDLEAQQLNLLQEQLSEAQRLCALAEAEYCSEAAAVETLSTARETRFGTRDADSEASAAKEALETLSAAKKTAEVDYREKREAHLKGEQQWQDHENRLHALQQRLAPVASGFTEALAAHGFGDEASYNGAILDPETRRAWQTKAQQLQRQRDQWQHEQQEREQQLTRLQLPTDFDVEQAEATLEATQNTLNEALKQQGAIQAQLAQHAASQQAQQTHLQRLQHLQREDEHWKVMYDLIGASDGKRYRDFAQGLTFDVVLSHANVQLQKMSGRYLLVRSSTYDLELSVMDQQQGGEVRSAQNLSGGESFIVSMALALGLSQMASHNVQVDSLFLDEGFGTLDEEALEVALNTLAELHQENKLIGVISHVPSLKERISTQIKVAPLSGGVSRLEGPGCQHKKT